MKWLIIGISLILFACEGKEKGKVRVTASIHNSSSDTLVISDQSGTVIQNLLPGGSFLLAQEKSFDSPSRPLCCPCAADANKFSITPSDIKKKLKTDINDAALWNKHTYIKIENWICTFSIQTADIVAK